MVSERTRRRPQRTSSRRRCRVPSAASPGIDAALLGDGRSRLRPGEVTLAHDEERRRSPTKSDDEATCRCGRLTRVARGEESGEAPRNRGDDEDRPDLQDNINNLAGRCQWILDLR